MLLPNGLAIQVTLWQHVGLFAKEMIPPNDPALVTMALEALNFDKESPLFAW